MNQNQRKSLDARVVIYGGGVGGAQLAKKLSGKVKVTLVDPLDYFEVPMAAPRNLVRPDFAERAIMSFADALPDVEHVRARLVGLHVDGGLIETSGGQRTLISGDITVLATGSRFASELVRAVEGSASERKDLYARFHERLSAAKRVLIVGGGPIGVEIAGEISEAWPDKAITLIEGGPRLLAGTSEKAAAHAASVLAERGSPSSLTIDWKAMLIRRAKSSPRAERRRRLPVGRFRTTCCCGAWAGGRTPATCKRSSHTS